MLLPSNASFTYFSPPNPLGNPRIPSSYPNQTFNLDNERPGYSQGLSNNITQRPPAPLTGVVSRPSPPGPQTPVKASQPPNSVSPAESTPPNPLAELSKFTLSHNGSGLHTLNYVLNNISFVAAALHGGNKLRGIADQRRKTIPGVYEPNKYAGVWPGLYSPKMVARRHLLDTGLALNCSWDSFDAFARYSSDTGSVGCGLAAGLTEAVNQFGFNFFYAEPIIYGSMDLTMKLLAKLFPKSQLHQINRELAEKIPKSLAKNGIPMSYRLIRSLVGGSVGILIINGIMTSFSKWVTPVAVKHLGPTIDWLYAGKHPMQSTPSANT